MNYIQQGLSSSGDDLIKSTIFEEDEESQSATPNRKAQTEEEDISLPAFPELQYLDISSNLVRIQQLIFFFFIRKSPYLSVKINEEDDVMAVASWPGLTEIVLTDNPLIQNHVGLPPLVESFLIDRLGMKVHR